MNLQEELLQWCRLQSIDNLKHILTVKAPSNCHYLKLILSYEPDCKPIDRLTHAYSQTRVQNEKGFYMRSNYRYKKKKEEKMQMDKVLLENITVSRLCPYAFSVKKAFIESGELRKCMMLYSNNLAFHYYEAKQPQSADKQIISIWFDPTHTHSITEWLIYLLELEIYESYKASKNIKTMMITPLNHFKFVDENISREAVKKYLQTIVTLQVEKRQGPKHKKHTKSQSIFEWDEEEEQAPIQIRSQQAPYLLTRCLQKFQNCDRSISQVIFEYEWYSADRHSKVNSVLKDLCKVVVKKYKDEDIAYKAKQIEAIGQVKKKKKRNKKPKEDKEEQEKTQSNKSQSLSDDEHQLDSKKPAEKKKEETGSKLPQKDESIRPQVEVQQVKKSKSGKKRKEAEKQEVLLSKSPKKDIQVKKEESLLTDRINEYILSFEQQLLQSSQAIDKTRKNCLQTIEHTIEGMSIKTKWELVLFGSYSIDFALRDSDLDLALIIDDSEGCSIDLLFQHFKAQQWLRNCNIVQIQSAKVFILEFQIILANLKHMKPKDGRKPREGIHVDISITVRKNTHEGIRNTAIMKELFQKEPNLKVVSLIFKQLLRIFELNKPFRGGIGSYVLVILVHNILKKQQTKMEGNYLEQLLAVCTFMTENFQPYQTLISPHQKSTLTANQKLQLNIEDPRDTYLLNTSKIRQINQILGVFKQFLKLLQEVRSALGEVNLEERKKMKRIFFEHWNVLFKPQEEQNH